MLLKHWNVVVSPEDTLHLKGFVFGSKKFKDGDDIITSEIQFFDSITGTCTTKNNKYKLYGFDYTNINLEIKF